VLRGGTSFGAVKLQGRSGLVGHDDHSIGKGSGPGLVGIKTVIPLCPYQGVGHVHRPPEPFDSVILVGDDLDILDNCPISYTTQGKAVDLIVLSDGDSPVSDGDVLEYPGIVRRVRSSVLSVGF